MAPSAISPPASPVVFSRDGSQRDLNGNQKSSNGPGYRGYDHITWYVGNAKQAASFYTTRMGFRTLARRGLETGSRLTASHVVTNGAATFVLTSPLRTSDKVEQDATKEDVALLEEIQVHLKQHGDAVKDVAFEVDDVDCVYDRAVGQGAVSIRKPAVLSDKNGEVKTAVIKTYGDTTHTLVERSRYHGAFLPGFRAVTAEDPLSKMLPQVPIEAIDHCVGNQGWGEMEDICD